MATALKIGEQSQIRTVGCAAFAVRLETEGRKGERNEASQQVMSEGVFDLEQGSEDVWKVLRETRTYLFMA